VVSVWYENTVHVTPPVTTSSAPYTHIMPKKLHIAVSLPCVILQSMPQVLILQSVPEVHVHLEYKIFHSSCMWIWNMSHAYFNYFRCWKWFTHSCTYLVCAENV